MIDKKIKNLVSLLNKVNYIKTISSCEGHFEDYTRLMYNLSRNSIESPIKQSYTSKHSGAYIMFMLNKTKVKTSIEWELEKLVNKLSFAGAYGPKEAVIQITKRYSFSSSKSYFLPTNWRIDFIISGVSLPADKKKEMTDSSIKKAEIAVKEYLKSYKKHPIVYYLGDKDKRNLLYRIEKIRKDL
jgi:hypothetical protein